MPRSSEVEREEVVVYKDRYYSRLDIGSVTKLDIPEVRGIPGVVYIPETEIKVEYRDSVRYVVLDREFKILENEDVKIWYSGVDPTIDSLYVRSKTIIQNTPWKRHSLLFGAEAGYYSDFRMSVGVTYQYDVFKWLNAHVSLGYDYYIEQPYIMTGLKIRLYSW